MAKPNKTTETALKVTDFINSYVESEQKKADSFELLKLMTQWSGFDPKMWGPTIIGFGSYHYKYASGHEGDAPMLGFSPRKAEFSLYVFSPTPENEYLLKDFGKFKMGKACIYVRRLADINVTALEKMCQATIQYLEANHECACRAK
ncbi:MAG: DUF1801 domain-containing protein [Chitinophagaceae bacterium]|nr:MAG: DUF1801 domain-containing protein [Chitinophagaceae bacterium]